MTPECHWHQDGEDSDVWQTQCGHYMTIIEGTPAENEFAHCCFCGKSLVGHPFEANDEDGTDASLRRLSDVSKRADHAHR